MALPLAGLLALVGLFFDTFNVSFVFSSSEPSEVAQALTTTDYFMSQLVGHVLGLTVLIFGVLALFAYLATNGARGLALGAMVLSIGGIALALSAFGVTTYVLPALGQAYLMGHQENPITMTGVIFGGPLQTAYILLFLLYSAGFILFGVAVWRSGALPKWAGVLLAIHAPLLLSGALLGVGSLLGALLLVVGGAGIALSALRGPSVPAETEAEPRVR